MAKKIDPVHELASRGGKARAEQLSPAERQDIARRAVQARWAKAQKAERQPNASKVE
jgi:hypothetical protein